MPVGGALAAEGVGHTPGSEECGGEGDVVARDDPREVFRVTERLTDRSVRDVHNGDIERGEKRANAHQRTTPWSTASSRQNDRVDQCACRPMTDTRCSSVMVVPYRNAVAQFSTAALVASSVSVA
jgi:hypothetical protein